MQTRWLVMPLVLTFFVAEGFTEAFFGQINVIVARYFGIQVHAVDWFTLTPMISCGVALFVMTCSISTSPFQVRKWCLTSAALLDFTFLFLIAAWVVRCRQFMAFAIIGQLLSGVASAITYSLAAAVVRSWFPQKHWLASLSLFHTARDFGHILGFVVPASTLSVITTTAKNLETAPHQPTDDWSRKVAVQMIAVFSSFLIISVIVSFSCYLFVYNPPQSSESSDEPERLTAEVPERYHSDGVPSGYRAGMLKTWEKASMIISKWLRTSKDLLQAKLFLALALAFSLMKSITIVWYILASDMLFSYYESATSRNASPEMTWSDTNIAQYSSDTISGCTMTIHAGISFVTGVIAYKILRNSCSCTCTAFVGLTGITLSLAGLLICFNFHSVRGIFAFMFPFGSFNVIVCTAILSRIEHHVPDGTIVIRYTWINMFSAFLGFLLPILSRKIFSQSGSVGVISFQILQCFIVGIFLLFTMK